MKRKIINNITNYILKYHDGNYDVIAYGVEGLYILLVKSILILILSYLLNSIDKMLLFTLLFALIRIPGFGLHMKNGIVCLFISIVLFALIPSILLKVEISSIVKTLLSIFSLIMIIIYAPADTYKRPIYKRKKYKAASIISALFLIYIVFNNSNSNYALYALILETILISPISYKLLNLPYANYERR
jgi:accessory gene regulator B